MLGFRYIKFDPTQHVILFRDGRVVKEGSGLAFWYFAPSASIVAVPLGSIEAPFIFEEVTSDFQEVTVQGQITFRIRDPRAASGLLNYTLDARGSRYVSTDPEKLPLRVVNAINVLTRSRILGMKLREAIVAGDSLVEGIEKDLRERTDIKSLGIEILGLSILAIKPTPDTARALEAETREQLLREADDAVYQRRNSSVEQERMIKENELETEKAIQQRRQGLETANTTHQIQLEEKRKDLVRLEAENARIEAESRSFALREVIESLSSADPRIVQSLAGIGMQPDKLIAMAMNELAGNARKIGELNIAPDLLRQLARSSGRGDSDFAQNISQSQR